MAWLEEVKEGLHMALEDYPTHAKKLASQVQRLRGWVGSDPTRTEELADTLVQLTDARLAAEAWTDAAADAQESVTICGRLLAAHGGFGPYTPASDAMRFMRATVHLADVQRGMCLLLAATKTIGTAEMVAEQVPQAPIGEHPDVCARALVIHGEAALSEQHVATANSYADAALSAAASAVPTLLRLRVMGFAADSRWEAGFSAESLAWAWAAWGIYRHEIYDASQHHPHPSRMERLLAPMIEVVSRLTTRLVHQEDFAWAISINREAQELVRAAAAFVPDVADDTSQLRYMLAADLYRASRLRESLLVVNQTQDSADSPKLAKARAKIEDALASGDAPPVDDVFDGLPHLTTHRNDVGAWPVTESVFAAGLPHDSGASHSARVREQWDQATNRVRPAMIAAEEALRIETLRLLDEQEQEAERLAAENTAKEARLAAEQAVQKQRADAEKRVRQEQREAEERSDSKRRRAERIAEHERLTRLREAHRRLAELKHQEEQTSDDSEREKIRTQTSQVQALVTELDPTGEDSTDW